MRSEKYIVYMKNLTRLICTLLTTIIIISCLSACSKDNGQKTVPFDEKAEKSLSSGLICSNDSFELLWDDDAKSVMFKRVDNEKIWSTVPYEYYLSGGMSANMNSGLNITVANSKTLQWDTLNGYREAFMNGRITSEKVDKGIKITYYFDNFKISVPVVYRLRKNSLEISLDPNKISENADYSVLSVSPAPCICSTANSENDSYLFIPSGSGALMYSKETSEGDRLFSGEVYGEDKSRLLTTRPIDDEQIYLPVFGVRDKNESLLAIIEGGESSALIEATAGNNRTGYSNVCADFYVRGYDTFESGTQAMSFSDLSQVSQEISTEIIKLGYYPLSGSDADYVGMAKRYKQYLIDKELMAKDNKADSDMDYGITILGGVLSSSTFLGIPSTTTDVLTTFSQAESIIAELNNSLSIKPRTMLSGFGDCGINAGKVAGGFGFSKIFGGNRQRIDVEEYCAKNKLNVYTDFELIRYSKSGVGYSYLFDAAKSATKRTVEISPIKTPLRDLDSTVKYRLLKRSDLGKTVKKLIDKADKISVSGIGLSSLGNIAYSDYLDSRYYSKGSISEDVTKYLKEIKDSKHAIATRSANAYAAAISDAIYDVPVSNGEYQSLDETIPFYQMVFGGSKPLYSSALNYADHYKRHIMLSVVGGTRISFALINEFDLSDLEVQSEKLYAAVYDSNKEFIKQTINEYESFYKSIAGSSIENYEFLGNGISKTVFDNGVVLYANHKSVETDSPVGLLGAYDIKWVEN